jgi:hypothetical protein
MNHPLVSPRYWLGCIIAIAIASQAAAQQSRPNPYVGGDASAASPGAALAAPTSAPAAKSFKPEELEQLVAGVALYPDALLSQVLMASTYPVEIVQADRWAKQNKSLKGDALAKELEKQAWDPAVRSLVNFPEVLTMMSEKLDWTVKLGDAFIAQQKDVMETVQRLRAKAKDQGNLASNSQQKVSTEPVPASQASTSSNTQIIKIESSSPDVVYVPTYNPTVVYGGWPYPSYPPYYYYPPSYVPGQAAVAFGVGVAIGAAWGYAWGGCNWGNNDVDIDIDRNTNINTNIDRDKYKAERDARQTDRQGNRSERQGNRDGSRGGASSFQHDPSHRGGVAYRDQATAQRFGGQSSAQATQAREAYRGRAEAGRTDIQRSGADAYRPGGNNSYGGRDSTRSPYSSGAADRATSSNRPSQTGTRSGAFDSAGSSGSQSRSYSNRGQSSRSGGGYSSGGGGSRSTPARSSGGGGSRGGGGGSRGGGGGRR